MHLIILLLVFALLLYGPQWWVQYVLARYNRRQEDFPGTGGELARHLLDRFDMQQVRVEVAEGTGDHYDPEQQVVRLTRDKLDGRTLTAIATAAHEVGHALQHAQGYRPFLWRQRLARTAQWSGRVGSFLLFAVPMLTLITKAPAAGILMFLAAIATLGMTVLVQLVTLPVEWDASFGRALPILESGYINRSQQAAARRVLRACALTYFAASLAGLLNFWRWMRLLRH
jgi:Zn-dependent membrane protease YugP